MSELQDNIGDVMEIGFQTAHDDDSSPKLDEAGETRKMAEKLLEAIDVKPRTESMRQFLLRKLWATMRQAENSGEAAAS
jgi:hypothetical protein